MQENTIFVKHYSAGDTLFPVNEKEIARYAGYYGVNDTMEEGVNALMHLVMDEMRDALSFRVCYRRMDVVWENGRPVLQSDSGPNRQEKWLSSSAMLAECLAGSSEVVLFAATAGLAIDRYIAKNQRISPTKALFAQAYGAERVESLCNGFCREMELQAAKSGLSCTARFSPGYGDLKLETQKDIFRMLDCSRQIGVTLNDSLLMTPSKSVTAIFGIGECVGGKRRNKCRDCGKTDCELRTVEEER